MHIGAGFLFHATSSPPDSTDFGAQAGLIEQVESLGFDSIWTAEQPLSRHDTTPNPAQLLAWVAGRTSRALIGSIVSLEAWHNPVRIAEALSVLDVLSDGRVVFGVGRGLGPTDFNGFRGDAAESGARVTEYMRAIAGALESGVLSSPGPLYKQPQIAICPRTRFSFRGRMYAMIDSPESAAVMAQLGFGALLIADRPWDDVLAQARRYAELYASVHDCEAPRPVLLSLTCVDADPGRARALQDTYAAPYATRTIDRGVADPCRQDAYRALRFMKDLQLSGTPQEVIDNSVDRVRSLDAAALINVLTMDGMPPDVARRSLVTYARDVLPQLRAVDAFRTIGRARASSPTGMLAA